MPTAGAVSPPPLAVAGDVSAEMTVVLANMVESALAGGLPAAPAALPQEVSGGDDARGAEGDRLAPAADRDRLHSTVHAGAGPRAHRVHRPPVRAGRRSSQVGLAGRRHRGHRRRPGPVRAQHHPPGRVQAPGGPGVPGRGRGGVRVGGLPAGAVQRRPVQAAGAGPADRHPGHRRRRDLRPVRHQRPPPAGP
jgi:hypothetical protein